MPRRVFQVKPEEEGERIDRLLSVMEWAPSRAYIQKLLKNGKVFVNGSPVKASYRLAPGDEIIVEENEPAPAGVKAQPLPLDILYEDEDLLSLINPGDGGPSGVATRRIPWLTPYWPAGSCRGSAAWPARNCSQAGQSTSGVLVAAKNDFTHLALATGFNNGR